MSNFANGSLITREDKDGSITFGILCKKKRNEWRVFWSDNGYGNMFSTPILASYVRSDVLKVVEA